MMAKTHIARAAILTVVLGGAAASMHAGQQAATPAGQPSSAQSPQSASAGNADAGRQTYTKKGCYACHGREGQGSPTTGPRLGPNPTPLAAFTRYVRAPRGQMPPYTDKVVSDAELADMHAFLQARPRPIAIDNPLLPK